MMMERLKSSFQCSLLIFLAFLTACKTNAGENSPDIATDASDMKDLINGDIHYKRLVWDPTRSTVTVFNVSGSSPLHIVLIRKKIGHCEMFFLRLRGILESQGSSIVMVCVAELSAESLEEKCKWVNDSGTVDINQGNIYGMPEDCGPWYLTIYVPESSNATELAVEISEPYDPLVFRWFRVITNLAIWPAIVVAFMRRYYAEAIIYFLTFAFSTTYHLCEAELSCFKGYSRMHFSDYFASDLSIVCTIWSMTRIQPPKKHILFLTVAILLQFAVYETLNATFHFVMDVIFAGPALIYVIYVHIYRTVKYKRLYPSPRRWLFNLLPGCSLALTGAIVNLVISGHENYYYVHCIWHLTIMLSVAFLLPIPADQDPDERWWTEKLERDTYTPLS